MSVDSLSNQNICSGPGIALHMCNSSKQKTKKEDHELWSCVCYSFNPVPPQKRLRNCINFKKYNSYTCCLQEIHLTSKAT